MNVTLTERMEQINAFFEGVPFYYVGGAVRDLLMGSDPKDYDLTTPWTPDQTEEFIRSNGRRVWKVGQKFGTVGVKIEGQLVEITTFRTEQYTPEAGRKPEVRWGQSIAEDLQRRDFTINAIAARPDGSLVDPFGGQKDLEDGVLRAVGSPKTRFREDPLRILRGVRLASRFNLDIEKATAKRIESMRWDLLRLSKERIVDEVGKMMLLGPAKAAKAIERMFDFGLWQPIFPELHLQYNFDQQNPHHAHKLHRHSIRVMESALAASEAQGTTPEDRRLHGWTALLHDVAKPFTKTLHKSGTRYNYIDHDRLGAEMVRRWMTDYRFSNADVKFVSDTVRDHLSDDNWLRPHDKAGKTVDPAYYLEGGGPHAKLMEGAAVYIGSEWISKMVEDDKELER